MCCRLVFLVSLANALVAAPLFFFGDSLTDSGNVHRATTVLSQYTLGLIPVEPSAPYVGGAFTNGPVWAERVAMQYGRTNDAEPAGMALGLGQIGGAGNNYAIGGARTGTGGALGFLDVVLPTGILTQVDFYLSREGGQADPAGFYFVFGGGNDLRDAARRNGAAQREAAAINAGSNIAYAVQRLYFAGARNFVLVNAPDVGLIPESIGDRVEAAGTEVSRYFNNYLRAYADYLHWIPDLAVQHFDLFALHHELVAQYGYDSIRPCRDAPETCAETLFFDGIHPNARVHEIIGNRMAAQLFGGQSSMLATAAATSDVPEPSTGVLLAAGLVLVAVVRRSVISR